MKGTVEKGVEKGRDLHYCCSGFVYQYHTSVPFPHHSICCLARIWGESIRRFVHYLIYKAYLVVSSTSLSSFVRLFRLFVTIRSNLQHFHHLILLIFFSSSPVHFVRRSCCGFSDLVSSFGKCVRILGTLSLIPTWKPVSSRKAPYNTQLRYYHHTKPFV